jgi:hypothetical protein
MNERSSKVSGGTVKSQERAATYHSRILTAKEEK